LDAAGALDRKVVGRDRLPTYAIAAKFDKLYR
jgi:hypothetical protein